ncbi:calcium/hydrogen antiporter [Aspergillus mulundensis]|uniref:Putative Calcium hydrogen exchanger n=1 Tax=Aspergillus mulundensis TaxID=1810919 RepID=A0A3D8QZL0_9EURO|nr:putative Calcium hydrogen exchanger [Aspergillus mulundensis]RDW67100.1 putative Calcium hydrogen exchanger [Aspergillus mulundensis]
MTDKQGDARATLSFAPSDSSSRLTPTVSGENTRTSSGTVRLSRMTSQTRSYGTLDTPVRSTVDPQFTESQAESSSRVPLPGSPSIAPLQMDGDKLRKPPVTRRMSSKRHIPHKGQEFSTDDDVHEIEEDIALQASTTQPSPRIGPVRKQSSLRRRLNPRVNPFASPGNDDDNEDEYDDDIGLPEPSLDASGKDSSSQLPDDDDDDDDERMNDEEAEDDETSDAESFTLKDRQQAINETHPFGIRLWKPALYKKSRSVEKTAEGDIHSSPGGRVSTLLFLMNLLWTLFFGWWLAIAALLGAIACFIFSYSTSAVEYGKAFSGLSWYLFYPFGSFVRLDTDEHYADEDEGEGRSISEYAQWQSGDLENGGLFFGPPRNRSLVGRRRNSVDSAGEQDSLLGRAPRAGSEDSSLRPKRRLFGRGEWTLGRVVFFVFFYFLVGPLMLLVSLICWLLVFWIPMGRVTLILFDHLRRHPLALSYHSDMTFTRISPGSSASVLLCTYRAAGLRYWKYTVGGTNVFLINLLAVVVFVVFDYFLLREALGLHIWITHPGLIFTLALLSVIPLAYFIGQAVASISAQSSMGMGAAVNAFFSTVVEVYLYCVALTEGKGRLVEGSIVGSIFAGILFLPGLSMCFGAIKRKTQRFNVKSAGVTSTMLLFAVIAAFGPTLFYQVYGSHELNCHACESDMEPGSSDCRRCYFSQVPAINDGFFQKAVQPYSWIAAIFLFLSYVIGLWFTLRTHAALIWATEIDEKKAAPLTQEQSTDDSRHEFFSATHLAASSGNTGSRNSVRDSQLYRRILGQSLRDVGLTENAGEYDTNQPEYDPPRGNSTTPYLVPRKEGNDNQSPFTEYTGFSGEQNENLVRKVTEVAATAATVAARDVARTRKLSGPRGLARPGTKSALSKQVKPILEDHDDVGLEQSPTTSGGHDAPNWSRTKSSVILLVATVFYAVIAEILVNTVDVVLESVDVDEKFLGITLFALVPNTTEFLNAISFAMNGNIALSMEIGSAYALQVCLLQIPALVLFSAFYARALDPEHLITHSFNLIFAQWDMITVILCVFLLSYVYGEGKSNYFKGSVLVLTYLVVVSGFFLSGYSNMDTMGVDRFDTLALGGRSENR